MMSESGSYSVLSDTEVENFLQFGHIILKDCFSKEIAEVWINRAFERLGCAKDDPSTWRIDRIHMPSTMQVEMETFTPKLWAAVCDLLGGAERIRKQYIWDSFIVNLRYGMEQPWEPPSSNLKGWHKDGDSFRHFLDSPEQVLQVLMVWTDIGPRGGGTFVACDSVPVVAKFLLERPEGVLPYSFAYWRLIRQCHVFRELTASAGDVILMHPYLLHAASPNHSGVPRVVTNPPVQLLQPMNFNRKNPADYSPVELAVLQGLKVERIEFQISAPRESFVPERAATQQRLRIEERMRLGSNRAYSIEAK